MTNFRIALIALAFGAFIFQSCTSEKKEATEEHEEMKHDEMDHQDQMDGEMMEDSTVVSKIEASAVSKEQLESMLAGYFKVKNALVKTDAKEAKSAAAKLAASLGEGMDELTALVKGMTEKEDVEMIRKDFDQLSASMYSVVKANSDKKEATVYKQFCPMAFNNQGAFWLSNEPEIRNPYFGDKMLKCGKVQEEL
jgi:molecular chaperone GrpE (heat shock protein)